MIKPQPGDIGFARTGGVMGKLIRIGEFLRGKRGSQWNHQFAVSDKVDSDGMPFIIQATLRGVTDTARLDSLKKGGGRYLTQPPPDAVDRHEFLVFLKSQVGTEYGFFTILAIAIDIVTWDWFPSFRGARKSSWICSALINEGMRFAGWLHQWPDIYTVTPQDGWNALAPWDGWRAP